MSKKINQEAEDFENLQELGFEFNNPQDEFSYQPDSGGVASGQIGKQEYGIDADIDVASRDIIARANMIEDPEVTVPGESEWSQNHRLPDETLSNEFNGESDDAVFIMINDILLEYPEFNQLDINAEVEGGQVILSGDIPSAELSQQLCELISELPGVTFLKNELTILAE